jgi:PKD domain
MVRLIGMNENDLDARQIANQEISSEDAGGVGRHMQCHDIKNMSRLGRQFVRRYACLVPSSVVAMMMSLGLPAQAQELGDDDAANANLPEVVRQALDGVAGASAPDHTVAVFYVIPRDINFEEEVLNRVIGATKDVQAWYQCATGGVTWELAFPEVVRVYFGDRTRQEYIGGGYYGPILAEMMSKGLPIFTPGTVAALWSRGAGFFAGANPGCDGECGVAMIGVEAFPEFNNPEWSGGTCPPGEGVAAFPCTPVGAFAHELGHALASLFHPFDVEETRDVAFHSIMQTHWNYPTFAPESERPWGFLTVERQSLRSSPFLKKDIGLLQPHDCDVVNLPNTGEVPIASFRTRTRGLTLSLTNGSRQATLLYWTFGDGSVSNNEQRRLLHKYEEQGTYTVTLRASSDQSMIDLSSREIKVRQPMRHVTGFR